MFVVNLLIFVPLLASEATAGQVSIRDCPGFKDDKQETTAVGVVTIEINDVCGSPPFILVGGKTVTVQITSDFNDTSGKIQLNYALRELRHGSVPVQVTEESWIPFASGSVLPSSGSYESVDAANTNYQSTDVTLVRNLTIAHLEDEIPILLATIARAVEFQIVFVDHAGEVGVCKQMFVYLLEPEGNNYYERRRPTAFPYFYYNPYRSISSYR